MQGAGADKGKGAFVGARGGENKGKCPADGVVEGATKKRRCTSRGNFM